MLVADASGIHFEPAIIVDLHDVDVEHLVVSLKTKSGNVISLTHDHMMLVH